MRSPYRLPLPPSANALVMPIRMGRGARLAKTPEARAWRDEAVKRLETFGAQPLGGPLKMTAVFVVRSIASDGANRLKALEDALKGIMLHDDSQIVAWELHKRVTREGEPEHVLFELEACDTDERTAERLAGSKTATGRAA